MPVNSRGERVKTHNRKKQSAWANSLRKPKTPTGSNSVGGASA